MTVHGAAEPRVMYEKLKAATRLYDISQERHPFSAISPPSQLCTLQC